MTTKLERIQSRHRQKLAGNYTLLEPVNYKSNVRGYWTDSQGKLYKDWLSCKVYHSWQVVKIEAVNLCKVKRQLCIFVKGSRAGYIINKAGKVTDYFKVKRIIPLKSWGAIRQAIRQYTSGLTIYKDIRGYKAEVYF